MTINVVAGLLGWCRLSLGGSMRAAPRKCHTCQAKYPAHNRQQSGDLAKGRPGYKHGDGGNKVGGGAHFGGRRAGKGVGPSGETYGGREDTQVADLQGGGERRRGDL